MADERTSRNSNIAAAAIVAACAAATGLLLSGWTPGPSAPKPKPVATAAVPAPATTRLRPAPVERESAKDLFANECGICHTLAAAGTTGKAGPSLDRLRPSRARVLAAIRNGGRGSGLMQPNLVTGNDAAEIARFVAASTKP